VDGKRRSWELTGIICGNGGGEIILYSFRAVSVGSDVKYPANLSGLAAVRHFCGECRSCMHMSTAQARMRIYRLSALQRRQTTGPTFYSRPRI
jgi:hypothetical protein